MAWAIELAFIAPPAPLLNHEAKYSTISYPPPITITPCNCQLRYAGECATGAEVWSQDSDIQSPVAAVVQMLDGLFFVCFYRHTWVDVFFFLFLYLAAPNLWISCEREVLTKLQSAPREKLRKYV